MECNHSRGHIHTCSAQHILPLVLQCDLQEGVSPVEEAQTLHQAGQLTGQCSLHRHPHNGCCLYTHPTYKHVHTFRYHVYATICCLYAHPAYKHVHTFACMLQLAPTWKSMGARGRQAGVDVTVADLRIAVPKPPMAMTLPAGTCCSLSRPLPIIKYRPSTCTKAGRLHKSYSRLVPLHCSHECRHLHCVVTGPFSCTGGSYICTLFLC